MMTDDEKQNLYSMLGQHYNAQRTIDLLKEQQSGLEYHLAMIFQGHQQEAFELQEKFLDDKRMNGGG